jgi:hypothetical protein
MNSPWTLTEMARIGDIKQRTGAVDSGTRQQTLADCQRFASRHLGMTENESVDFRTAAVPIETPTALPAGDALHLAVARRLGARVASLDQRMHAATGALGLARYDF